MIVKPHIVKSDMTTAYQQIRRIFFVADFRPDGQHLKHRFNVGKRLPDFTIDSANKAEWLGKLHQEYMHHHKITNRLGAVLYRPRRQYHTAEHAKRENQRLTKIQPAERRPGFGGGGFILRH